MAFGINVWWRRVQGDRRAGPSLSTYNYESVWGQRALREMYAAVMEEPSARQPLVLPAPCRPGEVGRAGRGGAVSCWGL